MRRRNATKSTKFRFVIDADLEDIAGFSHKENSKYEPVCQAQSVATRRLLIQRSAEKSACFAELQLGIAKQENHST